MQDQLSLRVAALISLAFLPAITTAHHSFAATFDVSVVEELEGEVTDVKWQNPHVLFTLAGTDDEGRPVTYEIESHSLSIMRRMDISSDVLRVGDTVRVAGHPNRTSDNAMFVLNALLPGGNEIVFDPMGAGPRWSENIGTIEVWQASIEDAEAGEGIFRVWATSPLTDMNVWPFPEMFNPALNDRYDLTDAARQVLAGFDPLTDIPTLDCQPKGMPTIMEQPYPMEIVEEGGDIVIRMEEYNTVRTIHMGEDSPGEDAPASRLGYSVGRWDGDTLIVETTGLTWRWFNSVGVPLSDAAEIIERYTLRENGARLDLEMTVTDPQTFQTPVTVSKYWLALPGIRVQPYECLE
jgi:hypothetical protein